MPAGKNVRPSKWSQIIDLYDNGTYSAIWGKYATSPNEGRCLGGRWNGENSHKGFPNVCGNSVWHVENDVTPSMTKGLILTYNCSCKR